MVERRELITICRQIGTMMEVGVDFLRLTRALREQTDNPRLLELYDQIEHDMRMGENLADAIAKAPDVFSPFAVSLIRQGEARGDVEGAWHRLADSLKQEAQEDKDLGLELGLETTDSTTVDAQRASVATRGFSKSASATESIRIEKFQSAARRVLLGASSFLVALGALWCGAIAGAIAWQAMVPIQLFLAALWLLGMALWPSGRNFKTRKSPFSTELSPLDAPRIEPVRSQAMAQVAAPNSDLNSDIEETARQQSARTEELLRNFAPTFSVVEAPRGETDDLEDEQGSAKPNVEKRFQL